MGGLRQDFRDAARALGTTPGFTLAVALTLSIVIGVNTTVFSVVNAALLRPLPFRESNELVTYWVSSPQGTRKMEWTEGHVAVFREQSRTLAALAAYDGGSGFNLTGAGDPIRLNGTTITYNFFQVLGQEPMLGRTFLQEEDTRGSNHVVILSHALWRRQFAGDSSIIGRVLRLNDEPTEVVGVMPAGFDFPYRADLWVPVGLDAHDWSLYYIEPLARLKSGVSAAAAEEEINRLWRGTSQSADHPSIRVRPLTALVVGESRTPLVILLAAAVVVLLVACANLANLMMVRATRRAGEIAVRASLGATSMRIARALFAEGFLLAGIGLAGGVVVASFGIRIIQSLSSPAGAHIEQLDLLAIPIPRVDQAGLDAATLGFAIGLTLLVALLLGIAPALQGGRVAPELIFRGARGTAPPRSRRLTNALVVGQFTLSLALLASAGLLLQSLRNLFSIDLGFRPANVWVGRIELPAVTYPDDRAVRAFFARLLERVGQAPGAVVAGLCQRLPFFGGGDGNGFTAEGQTIRPDEPLLTSWWRDVSPGYFETMGIRIVAGRAFNATDTETSARVAIVDEKFAAQYWPGRDPIGRRIRLGPAAWNNQLMTVVGVVSSVKHATPDEDARPYVYWPATQDIRSSMYIVVRSASEPTAMTNAVRAEVTSLDPSVPLFEVSTMDQAVARWFVGRRLTILLVGAFSMAAVLLAAVGIYGVTSLSVGGRVREFGIRAALGGRPVDVMRLVLGEELRLVGIAIGLGLVVALWLGRALDRLLYHVAPTDPRVLSGVTLVLAGLALVATAIPARRATKVGPMEALRAE